VTALVIAVACSAAGFARAAEPDDPSRSVYLRYCGACHGPGGKGDGIVASILEKKPIDLTQLARRNGGEFPYMRTMQAIDGRTRVPAHGESDMPVWGEVFQERPGWEIGHRAEVLGKLMVLTEYIRSIQVK
jgi:mono/diheme cytochrome c family protein